MGFFDKFKKTKNENRKEDSVPVPWRILNNIKQLDAIVNQSKKQPVAIFKHSTRCGISRMVFKQFEKSYNLTDQQLHLYYLDLLNFRNVSDEVGYKFQVLHQSPQLIVIKNGIAVGHASHHSIHAGELENFIQ